MIFSVTKSEISVPDTQSHPAGCSFGRVFKKIALTLWDVAKIASKTAACFAVAVPAGAYAKDITSLAPYMSPGIVLAREGTAGCPYPYTPDACEKDLCRLMTHPEFPPFHDLEYANAGEYGISRTITAGCQNTQQPFAFLLKGRKFTNVVRAFTYANEAVLCDMFAFQDSPEAIIRTIKALQGAIVKDLGGQDDSFRNSIKIIVPTRKTNQAPLDVAREQLSERAYERFSSVFQSLQSRNTYLTADEVQVLNTVFFVPSQPNKIVEDMQAFSKALHARMVQGGDYIDHASFAHAEITRISPFVNGAGRLAWVFANLILAIGEEYPLVFTDKPLYDRKVREGTTDRKVLTEYFREQIAWAKSAIPSLDFLPRKVIEKASFAIPGLILKNLGRESCDLLTKSCRPSKLSPRIYANYQNALLFLERYDLAAITPEVIHALHRMLITGISPTEGEYRKSWRQVDDELIGKAQSVLSDEYLKKFYDSFRKVWKDISHFERLTEEEKAIWEQVVHLPSPPNSIPEAMQNFTKTLSLKIRQPHVDYIELSGWVQEELTRISPYDTGVNSLTLLLGNAILEYGKMNSLIYHNFIEYEQVRVLSVKRPGTLAAYMKKIVIPWNKAMKK